MSIDFNSQNYEFINLGINNEYYYNVIQQLDEIIEYNPDIITILIGPNDAESKIMTPKMQKFKKKMMKLPQIPDAKWFYSNLKKKETEFKKKTQALIAILSLSQISEDPSFRGI